MGRTCTVCALPNRNAVDEALVSGRPRAEISSAYGVTESAVQRHRKDHLSPALQVITAELKPGQAGKLVDRLWRLVDRVEALVDKADVAGNGPLTISAARELRSGLELLARMTGELDERPTTTINILQSDELAQIITVIRKELQPWPEARIAVADALDVLEISA